MKTDSQIRGSIVLSIATLALAFAGCHTAGVAGAGGASGPTGSGGSGDPPPLHDGGLGKVDIAAGTFDVAPGDISVQSEAGPQCAERAFKAEAAPLDLLLLVDVSPSMFFGIGPGSSATKWETMSKALMSFVRDPRSSGLGVGLTYFPAAGKTCETSADCSSNVPGVPAVYCQTEKSCAPVDLNNRMVCADPTDCPGGGACVPLGSCSLTGSYCWNVGGPCPGGQGTCTRVTPTCQPSSASGCDSVSYTKAVVDIGTLPASEPAVLRALADRSLSGVGTPLQPAAVGSLAYLAAHMKANPGRKTAMIIASDGAPESCDAGSNSVAGVARVLAAARIAAQPVSTYLVGIFSPEEAAAAKPLLDQLATAGGTGKATIVTASGDVTQKLEDAFNSIRGVALACQFQIPAPDKGTAIDFHKVSVRYTPGGPSARPEDLPYVGTADRCDPKLGGWYYDVNPGVGTPSLVKVCDSGCARLQADANGRVDLVFGCASVVIF